MLLFRNIENFPFLSCVKKNVKKEHIALMSTQKSIHMLNIKEKQEKCQNAKNKSGSLKEIKLSLQAMTQIQYIPSLVNKS